MDGNGTGAFPRGDRLPTVRLVSFSDRGGGAAAAALRLHQALRVHGIESRLRVAIQRTNEPGVEQPASRIARLAAQARPDIVHAVLARTIGRESLPRSPAVFATGLARELNRCREDVINLHWVNAEMISVAELGRIRRPVVWTLHDAWTFSGAEHLLDETGPERHVDGYHRHNRPVGVRGPDIDRWTWKRKRNAWHTPMTLVCPSEWLARQAKRSALCRDWPVMVIPNPIDTTRWRPMDRSRARAQLGLPSDKRIVLFGALEGVRDPNKGGNLLRETLAMLGGHHGLPDTELVTFGRAADAGDDHWPVPVRHLGALQDDLSLMAAYSAADAVVVPSRIENLPYTAIEAQACGTPVVAAAVGGLPECVEHLGSGYLAKSRSPAEMAEGLRFVLSDKETNARLSEAARQLVVARYDSSVVASRYLDAYRQALLADQRTE